MTLKQIHSESLEKMKEIGLKPYLLALRNANDGALNDVLNTNGCAYYQWTPGFIETLKPKQIVELGGAMGVWDLMALNGTYQDFDLHSITLAEGGLEFSYVVDKYPNFHPIVGDDLVLSNWGDLNLHDTDLWFFDSLHTPEQLKKELDLYSPFFKKGAVIMFDDIRSFGLWEVWREFVEGKESLEVTDPCHYSGFGLVRI